MMKKVAVIIPCFNEEESIAEVIADILSYKNDDYALIPVVVNDCSNDNSATVIKKTKAVLIDLPVNLGIGGAVQTGFKYAARNGFDFAVQVDGDGQHPVSEIGKIIQPLMTEDADIVIGSRFISKKGFQPTAFRRQGIKFL